jgi:hypothetical protein
MTKAPLIYRMGSMVVLQRIVSEEQRPMRAAGRRMTNSPSITAKAERARRDSFLRAKNRNAPITMSGMPTANSARAVQKHLVVHATLALVDAVLCIDAFAIAALDVEVAVVLPYSQLVNCGSIAMTRPRPTKIAARNFILHTLHTFE